MDFDGDGLSDILSGSWPGALYLFRRQADGGFAASEQIEDQNGRPINVGSASAVYAADWDGDADLDLLVGNIQGEVHFVANEGTREQPAYGNSQKLEADGQVIQVAHGDAGPCVADWDGDGLADLLVGSGAGSVLWYRNLGSTGEPKLAAAQTLVPENAAVGRVELDPQADGCGMRAKICATDMNGDGWLDLLLGDFSFKMVQRTDLTAEERETGKKLGAKLQKLLDKYAKLNNPPEDETPEAQEKREKQSEAVVQQLISLQEKYQKYQPTDYQQHGWVWLFVRKEPGSDAGG